MIFVNDIVIRGFKRGIVIEKNNKFYIKWNSRNIESLTDDIKIDVLGNKFNMWNGQVRILMGILELAEELREIAERKSKESGKSIQEVWEEAVKELDRIYKEHDLEIEDKKE